MVTTPLKCVVFDIGNVVWEFIPSFDRLFTKFAYILNTDLAGFRRSYYEKDGFYREFEYNRLDLFDWLNSIDPAFTPNTITQMLDQSFNLADFQKHLIPSSLRTIQLLRQRGLTVGYLSNAENFSYPYIHQRLEHYFDFGILSWKVGLRKPDPKIYKEIFKHGHWAPGEILFIDDKPENVAAAAALGLQTILYTDPSSLTHPSLAS